MTSQWGELCDVVRRSTSVCDVVRRHTSCTTSYDNILCLSHVNWPSHCDVVRHDPPCCIEIDGWCRSNQDGLDFCVVCRTTSYDVARSVNIRVAVYVIDKNDVVRHRTTSYEVVRSLKNLKELMHKESMNSLLDSLLYRFHCIRRCCLLVVLRWQLTKLSG
jgi:hypothetical protein